MTEGPSNGHELKRADGGHRSHLTDSHLNVLGFPYVHIDVHGALVKCLLYEAREKGDI